MNIIHTSGLTYRYGRRPALRGVDLTIPAGVVYALLGANGAGKTTLLHLLVGLRRAAAGEVRVFGKDPRRWALLLLANGASTIETNLDAIRALGLHSSNDLDLKPVDRTGAFIGVGLPDTSWMRDAHLAIIGWRVIRSRRVGAVVDRVTQ